MASTSEPRPPALQMTQEEVSAFLDGAFPVSVRSSLGVIEGLSAQRLRMRLDPLESMLRPGGIVSGPSLMALIDVAAYAIIAAHAGPQEMAVTTTLSVSFLRACRFERVFADAQILKLGRRLATVDVRIWQGDEERIVAQATVGYALP